MSAALDGRAVALASTQQGVVTRTQLLGLGFTSRMVDRRLGSGRLRPLHLGVYLLGDLTGPLRPPFAREMAAVLACGPEAVASHRSAAALWGVLPRPGMATPVEVTVPCSRRPRRPGIRVRRSADLAASDTTRHDGVPVTIPARTLADLAATLGARDLERAAVRAVRRGLLAEPEAAALLAGRHRRPGAGRLRTALRPEGDLALTRSEAEDRFLELVKAGGLPAPEVNVVVAGHEVDFLWRAGGLAVEVDGFAFHRSRRSFESDRLRDGELAAVGVQVIRVTWRQIVRDATPTLVRVAQALARASAGAVGS